MEKMQIIVSDFDSYKPPFSLWSIFYVQCGEACFPEHEHWDLTTTLLEMWLDNMCGLLFGVSTQCTLPFMNGDYSIQLILSGIHSVKVIWMKNKKAKGVFDEIDLLYFVRQLLSAASLALNHVQKEGDEHSSQNIPGRIAALRSAYHQIK